MKNLIVAREREQAVFERLANEPTAQMLVIRISDKGQKP